MICGWAVVGALFAAQQQSDRIGYEQLVEGLVDLRWMCAEPRPGERSETREAAGAGAAEIDFSGGPGVVGRIWCSRREGVLRIWVDGSPAPALAWPLADFSAIGRDEALPPDPLAGALGGGWYSVVPVPFTREVRIAVAADGAGETRLQVDLRLLGEGAGVEAFGPETLQQHGRALRRVARVIADDENPAAAADSKNVGEVWKKQPERILPEMPHFDGSYYFPLRGSGLLRWWTLQILYQDDRAKFDEILRGVQVRIESGTDLPSEQGRILLEMPLGELFGAGAGADPYRNYLMGLRSDDTFVCRLPMPFAENLKFAFTYPTRPSVKFMLMLGVDPLRPEDVPPLRLRGGWILADPADPAAFACALPGPARIVSASWSSECSTDAQWLDAPAFAFADGCTRPRPDSWSQVIRRDGPGRFGRFAMLRHYAHDAPVAAAGETLRFPAPSRYRGPAAEARAAMRVLYYGPARATETFGGSYAPEQRARLPQPRPPFFAIEGAYEGESLKLSSLSDGAELAVEDWSALGNPASRKEVLLFRPAPAGSQFGFAIRAPIAGEYRLLARVGAGPDLGPMTFLLDGKRVAEFDAAASDSRELREIVLHQGVFLPRDYVLTLRTPGGVPVALDCVHLEPVEK